MLAVRACRIQKEGLSFIGILDDFRIYDRPLSSEEIMLLANQTSKSPHPEGDIFINPKAGYRLNIAKHTKLSSITNSIGQIQFSPDGKRLAAVTGDGASKSGGIMVWNVADGKEVLATTRKSACLSLDWKPDSSVIAVGQKDGSAELIATDKGDTMLTYKSKDIGQSQAISFNPSGNKLAIAGTGGKGIKIISISDSDKESPNTEALYWLPAGKGHFYSVDWSLNGKLISAAGHNISFSAWDAISGIKKYNSQQHFYRRKTAGESLKSRGVSFSPKGERLMGSSYQNVVVMDSAKGGKNTPAFRSFRTCEQCGLEPQWKVRGFWRAGSVQ